PGDVTLISGIMAKQLRTFILAVIAVGIIGIMLFSFYPNLRLPKDSTKHVEKIVSATSRVIVVQDDGRQMFIDQGPLIKNSWTKKDKHMRWLKTAKFAYMPGKLTRLLRYMTP